MTVQPDFRLIAIDETRHYTGEGFVQKCGGRIFGIYVFDASSHTYCCEITPSYELHFLHSCPLSLPGGEEREAVLDALLECDAQFEPVSYFHTSTINAESCQRCSYQADDLEPEDIEQNDLARIDAVLEYLRSNHPDVKLPGVTR